MSSYPYGYGYGYPQPAQYNAMAYRRAQQKNGPSIGKMLLGIGLPLGGYAVGKRALVKNTLELTGQLKKEAIWKLLMERPELLKKNAPEVYSWLNNKLINENNDLKAQLDAALAQGKTVTQKSADAKKSVDEENKHIREAKNPATNPNEPTKPTQVETPATNSNNQVPVGANNQPGGATVSHQGVPGGDTTTSTASAGAGGTADAKDAALHTLQGTNTIKAAQAQEFPTDHGTNSDQVTDLINHGTTGADTSAITDHVSSDAASVGDLSNTSGSNSVADIVSEASEGSDVADAVSNIGSAIRSFFGFSRIRTYNCPLTHGNVYNFSRYRRYNGYDIVPTYFSSRGVSDDLPQDDANFLMRKMSTNRPLIPSLTGGGFSDLFYNKGTNKPLALGNVAFNMVMPVVATAALASNPLLALGTAITGVIANNAIYRGIKKSLLKREEAKRIKAGLPI